MKTYLSIFLTLSAIIVQAQNTFYVRAVGGIGGTSEFGFGWTAKKAFIAPGIGYEFDLKNNIGLELGLEYRDIGTTGRILIFPDCGNDYRWTCITSVEEATFSYHTINLPISVIYGNKTRFSVGLNPMYVVKQEISYTDQSEEALCQYYATSSFLLGANASIRQQVWAKDHRALEIMFAGHSQFYYNTNSAAASLSAGLNFRFGSKSN